MAQFRPQTTSYHQQLSRTAIMTLSVLIRFLTYQVRFYTEWNLDYFSIAQDWAKWPILVKTMLQFVTILCGDLEIILAQLFSRNYNPCKWQSIVQFCQWKLYNKHSWPNLRFKVSLPNTRLMKYFEIFLNNHKCLRGLMFKHWIKNYRLCVIKAPTILHINLDL